MTPREKKQKRIIRRLKEKVEEVLQQNIVYKETIKEQKERNNVFAMIRDTFKTGIFRDVKLVFFLFSIMDHQYTRQRRYRQLLNYEHEEDREIKRWIRQNIFEDEQGRVFFRCTVQYLIRDGGYSQRTQYNYLKTLSELGYVEIVYRKKNRFLFADKDRWRDILRNVREAKREKYRKMSRDF